MAETKPDIEETKIEIQTLKEAVEKIKAEKEKEQQECKLLEDTVTMLEKEKAAKDKTISDKEYTISNLTNQIQRLTEEIHVLKSKTITQVQLMSKHTSELVARIKEELSEAIRNSKTESEIDVLQCMKATDIQPDIPLLVVCFGTHTLSQEIAKTLKEISVPRKAAVIIVHLKAEHALPVQPSDRVLTDKECESLGGIYDVGFMSDAGLYKCNFNDRNVVSIVNFILRVGDKKPKVKY